MRATHRCPALFSNPAWIKVGRSLGLSARETQIAREILRDRKNQAIASALGISPHTIHTHVERIYRKVGVSSRVALVVRLVDQLLTLTVDPRASLPPFCARRATGLCPFRR